MERGVYCVVQTPLDEKDNIDNDVLKREIDWLISCGVKGLVLAMVSEVMRFTADESAEADGATALMATPPASFPATSSEIYAYYSAIIESVKIPLIVQDASNYMGQPLDLQLYGDLIEKYGTDRVQFKPEAKPVKERAAALQEIANGKAKIFEGQSGIDLLDTHPLGLMGTMPGGEIPWAIIKLWDCLEANDLELAQRIHNLVSQLVAFQQNIDGYVAVEKYLLVKQGIFDSVRQRGPVRTILSSQVKSDIDQIFDKLVKVVNN